MIIVPETKELIRIHTNALLVMHKWWSRHRKICHSICSLTDLHGTRPKSERKSRTASQRSAHIKLKLLLDFSRWIFRTKRTLSTSICHYFSVGNRCIYAVSHRKHTLMLLRLMCFVCGGTCSSFGTHCELAFQNFSLLLNIRNAKRLIRITSCRTFFSAGEIFANV